MLPNDLFADINSLILVFFVLLIVFDLILVRWLKLSKAAWKKSEYIWLAVASFGVISISAEVRNTVANDKMFIEQIRAETQFSLLRGYAGETKAPSYICRKFVRGEYSPPPEEFNASQKEYDEICKWNGQFLEGLPKNAGKLPEVQASQYLPNNKPKGVILNEYLTTLEMYITNYTSHRNEYLRLEKLKKKRWYEAMLFYYSPILLCFALALRITKVTGELRLK